MMFETAIIVAVVTTAAAFAAWRAWQTLRVARGEADSTACGGCSKGCSADS